MQITGNLLLLFAANSLGMMSFFFYERQQRRAFLETCQSLEAKLVLEEESQEQVITEFYLFLPRFSLLSTFYAWLIWPLWSSYNIISMDAMVIMVPMIWYEEENSWCNHHLSWCLYLFLLIQTANKSCLLSSMIPITFFWTSVLLLMTVINQKERIIF